MMRKFAQFLRGSVRVEVTGAAPERLLNALAGRDVRFWQGECVDALTLRLGLYTRDLPLARSLAARCQCELKVLRERGVPLVRRRLARRIALLVTAVVCFALLAASSLFVWDIDVEGNESVSTGEILRALAGCGVESGSFWPGWSADEIRNSVILDIPELSWVGVSVDSSRALVRVRERTEAPGLVSEDGAGSVTAAATGIIERMEVYQGLPVAAVGDAVVAGETLVSGEMPSEVGDTRYVRASAVVEARTWYERSISAPIEYTALEEAGTRSRWYLTVGGTRLNFYKRSSQTPAGCGKIVKEFPLAVEGVFTLPVTLVREQIVEYDAAPARRDADALAAELSAQLEDALARELQGRGEVLNATFTSSVSGSRLIVTMRAECREDIAVFTPAEQA